MTVANWIYLCGSLLVPCCALSFWPRETWEYVRQELEPGKPLLGLLLVMSAIGSVLTWWLPRLPPLPEKPLRTCARCESLVSSVPLGPDPAPVPCPHPRFLLDTGTPYCEDCGEELALRPPRTQEEADLLLEGVYLP